MARLAKRYRVIAPDLRGFGDSDKPAGPFGAPDHAADMLALLDALGIARAGRCRGSGNAAARAQGARTRRRTVLFRLRLSWNRITHGRARPAQRDLVSILQPDGHGAGDRRRV